MDFNWINEIPKDVDQVIITGTILQVVCLRKKSRCIVLDYERL